MRCLFLSLLLTFLCFAQQQQQQQQENHLPLLETSHHDAYVRGKEIGSFFKSQIKGALAEDPSLPQLLSWATQNATLWNQIWSTQTSLYPDYVKELSGVADGAGVSRLSIYLSNMEVDLLIMLPWISQVRFLKCSDVVSTHAMGHNEDDDSFFAGKCGLLLDHASGYGGFLYPGQLVGNAFSWNRHGLFFSSNQLTPLLWNVSGAGYYFLTRDALQSRTLHEAISRATRHSAFSGFSLNIGSVLGCANLEVWQNESVVTFPSPSLAHLNLYLYMNVSQQTDPSSVHRLQKYHQMGSPKTPTQIAAYLSDTSDLQYPVYRWNDSQGESTLATAIVDWSNHTLCIYNNKSDSNQPLYKFNL